MCATLLSAQQSLLPTINFPTAAQACMQLSCMDGSEWHGGVCHGQERRQQLTPRMLPHGMADALRAARPCAGCRKGMADALQPCNRPIGLPKQAHAPA